MCLALPAKVLAIEADHAIVDLDGRVRRASLLRMPDVSVGDWALVAAGAVLRRLDNAEAAEIRDLLRNATHEPDPIPADAPGGPR
jgi:hydrogenase expression/formation protein HypC